MILYQFREIGMKNLILVFLLILLIPLASAQQSKLETLTTCICPGYHFILECTVFGNNGLTVWLGSAFDCESGEITLRHVPEHFLTAHRMCNGVTVRGISIVGDVFISELNVGVNYELNGRTVTCLHDDSSTGSIEIVGNTTLYLTTVPFSSPSIISLNGVYSGQLNFNWSTVVENCPSIQYNVITSNCGDCPSNTADTNVTCTVSNVSNEERVCAFSVQTVVCDNIAGEVSAPLNIKLKVPEAPIVDVIPQYFRDNGTLTTIHSRLTKLGPFKISEEIDGSATSYTITFSDSISESVCGSATILASYFENGLCSHAFDVYTSLCSASANISVRIFATNVLGDGSITTKYIDANNTFFDVRFDLLAGSLNCNFLYASLGSTKSCSILYGPGKDCRNLTFMEGGTTTTVNTVTIILSEVSLNEIMQYCYIATAGNETFIAMVKGVFSTACNPRQLGDGTNESLVKECDSPYFTYPIKSGIVCYSGTKIGSTAFYSCASCGHESILKSGSLVRVCNVSGIWQGVTPQCSCATGKVSTLNSTLIITIFSILFLLISVGCSVMSIVTLCKYKVKVQELRNLSSGTPEQIYEEVDQRPTNTEMQPHTLSTVHDVDTSKNLAYDL